MKINFNDIVTALKGEVASPRLETRMILGHILSRESNDISPEEYELDEEQFSELRDIISKRLSKYPLDKLLGEKDFYKYRFKVSEDVLSPRPDTEVLVEAAVRLVSEQKLQTVLDMGTGSGCIILSLLAEFENLTGAAIDISEKALEIAKENARRLGLSNRIKFYHQSWFNEKMEQVLGERYDMVVSNPPYIATSEIDWLERDVKDHDPRLALDGGDDGYKHYRQIAKAAYGLLKQGGYILLEGGINQAEEIRKIFENENFEHKETCMDLAGIKRCIILKK